MNDELEPIDIDDRSPGERMAAAGRVGVSRIAQLIDEQRLDIAALIWMLCTVTFTGVQIYQAFHAFGGAGFDVSTWDRIGALGQTGGPIVAFACIVGILLGLTWNSAIARFSIFLAGIVGGWVFIAGIFDIAANVHNNTSGNFSFGATNRAVGAIGGIALAGFGLVVMMIAWRAGSVADEGSIG
jgi:hypothetical protein